MPKSIWKGEISFGLVSIPVSLYSTEEKKDFSFHLLDNKTKSRVHYQRVNEQNGKIVEWKDIVSGYEYEKGSYIVIDEKLFEKASPDLFKTIDIEEFVSLDEIDNLYFIKPYYLIPESKNKKAYVLLREALKKTNKVGVAKIMIRTKESMSLILPHNDSLLLYIIHFADEIRSEKNLDLPQENYKAYKITPAEIKMAESLIKDMTVTWEPEKYHNEYRETMEKWLDQQIKKQGKQTRKKTGAKEQATNGSVVDFITLLKESMKKNKAPAKKIKKSK